jgi:two-component system, cell cycle sensor histidine kinase and response regulator CckA
MLAESRLDSRRHGDRRRPSTCILERLDVTMAHETILLVEDEPVVRQLFVTALTRAGYTVLEAANGDEGVAIFDRHAAAIDLLVTDIRMPHMTGDQLARKLRERRPNLKVIWISGNGAPADSQDYLTKPFSREEMLDKIHEVLSRP